MRSREIAPVEVRRAARADREAILKLVPRLVAFGPPAWRDAAAMTATDGKVIAAALESSGDDPIVLVAVTASNAVMGFIHLRSAIDYYTERKHGHVADIVVDEAYEGRGIGRQLLAAADDWARAQHYEWLTLGVFSENTRAAQLYERAGFKKDIVRLLKPLR
jgi:ribosomal protein S18 acetylase RimI-like enzyme